MRSMRSWRAVCGLVAVVLALAVLVGQVSAQQLVLKVDLRKDQTAIRNQGMRGTCTNFAVTGAMEAAYKRAGYGDLELSAEFAHDVAKMMYLEPPDAKRPGNQTENQIAVFGGANPEYTLRMLCHGLVVPEARFGPYRLKDYPVSGKPDWKNQFVASSFNLDPLHLPLASLHAPRYFSVQSIRILAHPDDPKAIEQVLREGHEVVWSFRVAGDRTKPVWKYTGPPDPKNGSHAVLLVGYDRTDPAKPYFIVKNSWGKTKTPGADGFTYIAYDYLNYGTAACYITSVSKPGRRPRYAFLGRWYATFPDHKGILDIYRMPGVMQSIFEQRKYKDAKGKTLKDVRLGTFYEDGDVTRAYRVNGSFKGNTLTLSLDWSNPKMPYDQTGSYQITLTVAKGHPQLLEGALTGSSMPDSAATAQRLLSPEAFGNHPPSAALLAELPELVSAQ